MKFSLVSVLFVIQVLGFSFAFAEGDSEPEIDFGDKAESCEHYEGRLGFSTGTGKQQVFIRLYDNKTTYELVGAKADILTLVKTEDFEAGSHIDVCATPKKGDPKVLSVTSVKPVVGGT